MAFQISSSAFKEGGNIPEQYTCDGADLVPSLTWSEIPKGTQSLALICDDPDAPGGDFVHWVIPNIPSNKNALPEGLVQGLNDFGKSGYGGPCPPQGKPHRYFFKLYALDTTLHLSTGTNKAELQKAMKGHVLGETHLMGRYQRRLSTP